MHPYPVPAYSGKPTPATTYAVAPSPYVQPVAPQLAPQFLTQQQILANQQQQIAINQQQIAAQNALLAARNVPAPTLQGRGTALHGGLTAMQAAHLNQQTARLNQPVNAPSTMPSAPDFTRVAQRGGVQRDVPGTLPKG